MNWLHGRPTTVKPRSAYFSWSCSRPAYCGVRPHLLATLTSRAGLPPVSSPRVAGVPSRRAIGASRMRHAPRVVGRVAEAAVSVSRASVVRVSFVPVTGPATFRAAEPPREGVVEFTDDAPHGRAADPGGAAGADQGAQPRRPAPERRAALGRGAAGDAAGGGRQVRAEPPASGTGTPSWRISGLDEDDEERIEMLARAQRDDEQVVRDLHRRGGRRDAAAAAGGGGRAVPRRRPTEPAGPTFEERLQARLARHQPGRPDRPAAAGAALAAGRGRRGGAGRGRRTPGAAGARRAEPAAPLRPGHAVDPRRRRARLRRAGAHPRHDRAAGRGRRLAGARPAAGAAGARPDRARHRRAGQPARRRASARCATAASTCSGRAAWAAT